MDGKCAPSWKSSRMSARRRCTKNSASSLRPATVSKLTVASWGSSSPSSRMEGLFLSAVRGGGDQEQMPGVVVGESAQQPVPLLRGAGRRPGGRVRDAGVCLVGDHQAGTVAQEVLAVPGRLDEIGGHDVRAVRTEHRLSVRRLTLQAADGGGQHQLGFDAELVVQLGPPLLGERGRAEHHQSVGVALGEQLGGDQPRLDRLADPHVVGDQQPHRVLAQRHHERHELVRTRIHRD